jgi:GNAT superfamily N-acetyltransferase
VSEPPISLREAQSEDEPFLYSLYCDTRSEELDAWGWGAAERTTFLDLQYRARSLHRRTYFPGAEDFIVLLGGRAIGRLLTRRAGGQIHVVDLALMRENTSHGFGSLLIRRLQAEAMREGLPLRLQVAASSPAVRFYERLGFSLAENRGAHLLMEWLPRVHRPAHEQ